jgi:5-methyltetrahydrofolate--homocysteine methyltransferase
MSDQLLAIKDLCVRGKRAELLVAIKAAMADGVEAKTLMTDALIPAMSVIGEKYSKGEYFLPHMMLGARAMSEAMEAIKSELVKGTYERKAKAVVGTVAGDFHDIGKNIVKLMLEGGGYEVIDLGVDVSPERFVEVVKAESPRFVMLSALITLTMESMRGTIEALSAAGLRGQVLIGVGGAPVTQKFADEIGADFYSQDAYGCVEKCNQLLK